jgi:cell division protein FtsL
MTAATSPTRARTRPAVTRRASFIATWTLVVIATVCASVVHLALRGKTVSLGYELGRARAEEARLREVKRVLELEVASYKTPERVEIVARTLLGMETPPPERVIQMGARAPSTIEARSDEPAAPRSKAPLAAGEAPAPETP